MKRITVLMGNYGSGKTEIALNLALEAAEDSEDVTLVDLDIVNPYFRSSEYTAMLAQNGIRVIAPVYANTAVDLPTLPGEVYASFGGGITVYDCGGDAVGAAALGSLKPKFDTVREDTQVLFVVNTKRPFQRSAEEIANSMENVQHAARIRADGFVLNANLGAQTTGRELAEGYEIALTVAEKTGVPLYAVSGTDEALAVFKAQCPQFSGAFIRIEIFTRPEWMENS